MNERTLGVLALWFLLGSGLALDCDWDTSIDPDQALDPDAGAVRLGPPEEVSDPEECQAACCVKPNCDLALVGHPADGAPQCQLVSCVVLGRDACVLTRSSNFKVYRRKVEASSGVRRHIVPLLEAHEPRSNESNNIHCRLPMKVGSCRAAFPKFFYNVSDQQCHRFIYGGCDANANNFDSQEECESVCSGVTGSVLPVDSTPPPPPPVKAARMVPAFNTGPESEPAATESVPLQDTEHCAAEPQVGPCRAAFQHWFYNSQTGICQSFIYGGCRGNKNNYVSKESCMATCSVSVLPSSKKSSADDVSSDYKDQCTVTPDPGPCRAAFPKFYFDHNTGTCQSFLYGGCRGNHNRYGSMEECLTHCSRDGSFDSRGKTRHRWTAAFFVFVTLAAISVLLLVTLVLISLRRHRLSRRPSVSDKEELLPDPDEQSVDSMTLPESPKPDEA
ncbi:kunitz-type protease inhibitor 2 isoform X2 [Scophthalmus maximus]|uniref:Kunitz-type protease inhibitor 2-like n=1 Tax=Scophthalmus maximus TaxID=52904 RepID=A0A8D3CIU3_SCOMX|nr:kunitz-type protease inhibitor 2 isoform X2 [Scophthalmus maximus]